MTVDELYALLSISKSSRYCSGERREELLESTCQKVRFEFMQGAATTWSNTKRTKPEEHHHGAHVKVTLNSSCHWITKRCKQRVSCTKSD